MSAKDSIRAVIAGAGRMGWWHAHALTRAGGRLVAVVDTVETAAQRLAQAYGAPSFGSITELNPEERVEALHICTPVAGHAQLAATALNRGWHVLVEKPFAPDAAGTEKLLAIAAERHCLLIPVHQLLFQRGIEEMMARRGHLEPLLHLEVTAATAGGEGWGENALDQLIGEILPHPLSLFQRFLPEGIDGVDWTVRHPRPGEWHALGQCRQTTLAIHITAHGRPTRHVLNLIGAHGSAQADLFHGFSLFESQQVSRVQKIRRPLALGLRLFSNAGWNLLVRSWRNEPAYPGLRALIQAFYLAVRRQAPSPISPEEIQAVARARDCLLAQTTKVKP